MNVNAGMVKNAGSGRYNIRLKGIGLFRVKSNRELPEIERLVALRIKREGRKLWACLTYRLDMEDDVADDDVFPIPLARGVGIDMGVSDRSVPTLFM